MRYKYGLFLGLSFSILSLGIACSSDGNEYVPVPIQQSPVVVDLAQVPYAKLSDYKFFSGAMKNQKPAYGVLLYKPVSELFTDYALKKRFVWMPMGTKATYDGDAKVLNLPVGAALVKTFYYNNVQPSNTTRIIETRVMIRKATGWIFADYIWNDEQTEAILQMDGSYTAVSWTVNGVIKSSNYRIPSELECAACHKISNVVLPIGIKPQNLNYKYPDNVNQLSNWISKGYLENNLPANIVSVIDYNDTSKPLNLRVRSYFDANCGHCHQEGGYGDFYAMRFPFSETTTLANMGVCVTPNHFVPGQTGEIVKPGDLNRSILYYRMNTNDFSYRMPFLGRSITHEEGVGLVGDWILSLTDCE
ncbi:MAG TPA: hypothetical protein VK476_04430 [Flavobacterium sp.]|nr:hypothetical protein [Flavobacterium sp.]